jgi:hypothetical protein
MSSRILLDYSRAALRQSISSCLARLGPNAAVDGISLKFTAYLVRDWYFCRMDWATVAAVAFAAAFLVVVTLIARRLKGPKAPRD